MGGVSSGRARAEAGGARRGGDGSRSRGGGTQRPSRLSGSPLGLTWRGGRAAFRDQCLPLTLSKQGATGEARVCTTEKPMTMEFRSASVLLEQAPRVVGVRDWVFVALRARIRSVRGKSWGSSPRKEGVRNRSEASVGFDTNVSFLTRAGAYTHFRVDRPTTRASRTSRNETDF